MKSLRLYLGRFLAFVFQLVQLSLVFIVVLSIYNKYGLTYGVVSVFAAIPVIYLNILTWKYTLKDKLNNIAQKPKNVSLILKLV